MPRAQFHLPNVRTGTGGARRGFLHAHGEECTLSDEVLRSIARQVRREIDPAQPGRCVRMLEVMRDTQVPRETTLQGAGV